MNAEPTRLLIGLLALVALTTLPGITSCNTKCDSVDAQGNPIQVECVECSTPPVECAENVWYLPSGSTCLEEQRPALPDGTACSSGAGVCRAGLCDFPCTEQGILDAIAAGGGPHTFDCDGPTTVVAESIIDVNNDVVLDGLHKLKVTSGTALSAAFAIEVGTTAELRRLEAKGIANSGELLLTDVTVQMNEGSGIANSGELTVVRGLVSSNGYDGISNTGTLTVHASEISDNAQVGVRNSSWYSTATLTDVVLRANGAGSRLGGGAMNVNNSTLSMLRCVVSENVAAFGAGLYNLGAATLTETTVVANHATSSGGGIYNKTGYSDLILSSSTVSDNIADAFGGGIANYDYATLFVDATTISGNRVGFAQHLHAEGAGIYNAASSTMEIVGSVITRNVSERSGGGVHNSGPATMRVTGSTISWNRAEGGSGGGVRQRSYFDFESVITNSTISNNFAVNGSGVANQGELLLVSSTVAENTGAGFAIHEDPHEPGAASLQNSIVEGDCGGSAVTSYGHNIDVGGDTCGFTDPTDQVNVTPAALNLGPLQDNGGPTHTMLPGPGSVAIDQIPAVDCADAVGAPLTVDQRGIARPQGALCDIGAVEVAQP